MVTDHLYRRLPDRVEGVLAKVKASVVSAGSLAGVAVELGIGPVLKLGRGELIAGGQKKESILADAYEAVIGAIFLDGGLAAAAPIVLRSLEGRIGIAIEGPGDEDYKTRLQEYTLREFDCAPSYVLAESGPEHAKCFEAVVCLGHQAVGTGRGTSKKRAEQAAARAAWAALTEGDGFTMGDGVGSVGATGS